MTNSEESMPPPWLRSENDDVHSVEPSPEAHSDEPRPVDVPQSFDRGFGRVEPQPEPVARGWNPVSFHDGDADTEAPHGGRDVAPVEGGQHGNVPDSAQQAGQQSPRAHGNRASHPPPDQGLLARDTNREYPNPPVQSPYPQNPYPQNPYPQSPYVQNPYVQNQNPQNQTPHLQNPPAGQDGQGPAHQSAQVQRLAPPPGLEADRLVRGRAAGDRPQVTGWRRTLQTVSGGLITFGASKSQQQLDLMVQRVRQPVQGDFRLAVLSLKGGVGKTTTTLGLGSAFASLKGDRVIAVDANPDLGTLASRIPQQTPSTVRDLLNDPEMHRYTDVRRHTSQASSRLEILASERDPAISEAFSAEEYRNVVSILENYYNIIMTDCGTGLMHSAMEGVLSMANAIVVVTSPAVDGAQSASATLDWLNAHGYQRLVSQAVVVISASKPGGAPVDLQVLTEHFLGRCRAVQIVPYDHHLATGALVDLDQMHRRTRTAFLELAATVADSFAMTTSMPPGGHVAPWQG